MMFGEGTLEKLFKSMNSHVHVIKPFLVDMLEMEEPFYTDKLGIKYMISKGELPTYRTSSTSGARPCKYTDPSHDRHKL
jgi:uncharacterized protein (UPF0216 family)